jgi:subtilisin
MAARRSGRRSVFGAVLAAIALVMTAVGASASPPETQGYIVVLDAGTRDVPAIAADLARSHGGQVGYVYEHALKGFSIQVSARGAAALARNPQVAYVERDQVRSIQAQEIPTGVQRIFADDNTNISIDGADDWRVDVDVAIIDTGVDFEHPDLNVVGGVDCSGGGPFGGSCKAGGDDDHYHGTHVAGTVAAIDNGIGVVGVAPGARIWAVKVLDSRGSGYTSWINAGIDWVAANADTIEVANMSLGGSGFSQSEYDAIQGAVNKGVAFAVAAGNSDDDANNYSPAGFDNVLTVSALADFDGEPGGLTQEGCRADEDDTFANFSNWGDAVQVIAPGVCILSTFPIEQGEYGTISGTSMASPHAAGALALLASVDKPSNATEVHSLYDAVIGAGNDGWDNSDDGDDIKEPLLDVSNTTLFNPTLVAGGGDGGGDTNSPPTASFTYRCTDLACDFDGSTSSDSDGSIASYAWDFGDGSTGSGATVSHTYGAAGDYTVTLTVTDDADASDSDSQLVSVSEQSTGDFTLSVTGDKVRGLQKADLTWSGATSTNVDVYRDGALITTTANDGAYRDNIDQRGGGSYTYQVCEAGTSTCSNEATVDF